MLSAPNFILSEAKDRFLVLIRFFAQNDGPPR